MNYFWHFNEHNFRSKHKQKNDTIFLMYSLSSVHWYIPFLEFKTIKIQFTRSPFCIIFWFIKYTCTCLLCIMFWFVDFASFCYGKCYVKFDLDPMDYWLLRRNFFCGKIKIRNGCLNFTRQISTTSETHLIQGLNFWFNRNGVVSRK